MPSFSSLLNRHWGKLLAIVALGIAAVVVFAVPPIHARASETWRKALVWSGIEAAEAGASGVVYWCPMHPQIKRDDPTEVCPICNMALVPLEGGADAAPENLTLTARQVQQAGVVTEPVLRRRLYREIDTTGQIVSDERREATISSWVRGKSRIEELYIDFTGAHVQKGELMAELYSPELITAQEEYLSTLSGPRISGVDLTASARQKLLDQGMTPDQIDRLQRTRKALDRIPIRAPLSGTVLERHVQEGQYVTEGDVLFEISDLRRVWLLADVYEEELPLVEIGQPVQLSVRSLPGETFQGRVSFIDPVVQPQSRTVRVRIEVPNEDRQLKPGMYARARFRAELPETLAVAANAVLSSGQRQVAVVKAADGAFQPREIALGQKWLYAEAPFARPGDSLEFGADRVRYHQVLRGLRPGERVVSSGAFLLSAESQFQSVLTKMLPPHEYSVTLEQAVGGKLSSGIRDLVQRYYDLSAVLAEDRLEAVAPQLIALGRAAENLARRAEQENSAELASAARAIASQAFQASSPPPENLKEARTEFGRISRNTIRLLSENGGQTLFGEEMFLFRCGMSGVGYENWLWWSEEIINPYMGQEMLKCGKELEALEP